MAERTSQRTILEPNEVAVTYREKDGYQIYLPPDDDEKPLPQPAVVLVAVGSLGSPIVGNQPRRVIPATNHTC